MIRLALRSLASRRLRTALTIVAILLGVAMISGTYVLTDQIHNAFNDIFSDRLRARRRSRSRPGSGSARRATPRAPRSPCRRRLLARSAAGPRRALRRRHGAGRSRPSSSTASWSRATARRRSSSRTATPVRDRLVAGRRRAGEAAAEVAVTSGFAARHHLALGDAIAVVTDTRPQDAAHRRRLPLAGRGVAGRHHHGRRAARRRAALVRPRGPAEQHRRGRGARRDAPARCATGSAAALPATVDVKTGAQAAAEPEQPTPRRRSTASCSRRCWPSAAWPCFVGAFIIFNAFSITVAQRRREFAMLRALGASRRQVLATVTGEALAMGIAASLLGLVAGLGVAKAINALFKAVGADIPTGGLALSPRTIVVALRRRRRRDPAVGPVPALRATRVPPVAALQRGRAAPAVASRSSEHTGGDRSAPCWAPRCSRPAWSSAAATTTAAARDGRRRGAAVRGRWRCWPGTSCGRWPRLIGRPLQALAPTSGRLARENAARNPQRTAATAAALMIGLALVVFVAVFAQGLKTSFVDALANSNRADVVVTDDTGMMALPARGVAAVRALPGVETATGIAFGDAAGERRRRPTSAPSSPRRSRASGTSPGSRAAATRCSAGSAPARPSSRSSTPRATACTIGSTPHRATVAVRHDGHG